MRRLLVLASVMVFIDVAFFTAIAPLLPQYVDDLGLSKAEAGILTASYAAGTLAAAIPAGWVASRIGPRLTAIAGLLTLGVASLLFGLLDSFAPLAITRFVQGTSSSLIWAGAMTWLVTSTPEERRGSVIGTVLGIAVAGALLGPALGALAGAVGTGPVFGAVLVVTVTLSIAVRNIPDNAERRRGGVGAALRILVSRPVLVASAFVVSPSLMFGAVDVIVPLQIDAFGGGHGVIAAAFIAGAGIESVLAPLAGRMSDRIGRRAPYVIGLAICAAGMALVGLGGTIAVVVTGLALTSVGSGLCFAPAMTVITDLAEKSDLHQGYAAGLTNMAWAAGQMLGGLAGGAVAEVAGNAATGIAIAVLLTLTVVYALRAIEPEPIPGVATS